MYIYIYNCCTKLQFLIITVNIMKLSVVCFILLELAIVIYGFRSDYEYYAEAQGYLKFQRIPANWQEARLRCHLEGTHLASPLNAGLQSAMIKFMARQGGLNCGVFTGIHSTFSRGDFHSVEGIPLSKIPQKWAADEPDNYKDEEQCIMMQTSGEMADVKCSEPLPYFCYKKGKNLRLTGCGTVDPEYTLDSRTGSCYKFHTVPRTWSRAFMACTAEGGYLAIVNSETEATIMKELFAKHPGGSMLGYFWKDVAFLGFHDWGEHGEFLTINSQTLYDAGFSKFSGGEPNNATTGEFCGAIYRHGTLDDLWCENRYAFICEKDPNSLVEEDEEDE